MALKQNVCDWEGFYLQDFCESLLNFFHSLGKILHHFSWFLVFKCFQTFLTRIIVIIVILFCACCVYDVLVSFGFCSSKYLYCNSIVIRQTYLTSILLIIILHVYISHINFWLIGYQYVSTAKVKKVFSFRVSNVILFICYLVRYLSKTLWYIHSFFVHKGMFISTIAVEYPYSSLWQPKTRIC